ncbi:MAG: PQQ-dependent sugar dehydrogenase [Pseudomonadota bacterium]
MNPSKLLIPALALTSVACTAQSFESEHHDFKVETVAKGLEHPWSIAFLPDGDALVTERAGRLRLLEDGELREDPIGNVPEVAARGQGGLLDVVLHPDFEENKELVISYAHRNSDGMTTRVMHATLEDHRLTDRSVIFTAEPRSDTTHHFAGRMVFDDDHNLYVAVGDRGEKDRAQTTDDDAGGVHRITLEGEPAPGNPFLDDPDVNDTFYTYGNRNIQGMTRHPETGEVWSHEHGPKGGDEINIIQAGTNYGWPEITYGIDYDGSTISDETHKEGMAQPLHYWDPSIAPSGMAFYTGDQFPDWQGDLFVGALVMEKLVRLRLEDEEVVQEEDLLKDYGERIRAVSNGPDGSLWLLTDDSDGRAIRLVPR